MGGHFLYGFTWTLGALGAVLAVVSILVMGYLAVMFARAFWAVWRRRKR